MHIPYKIPFRVPGEGAHFEINAVMKHKQVLLYANEHRFDLATSSSSVYPARVLAKGSFEYGTHWALARTTCWTNPMKIA